MDDDLDPLNIGNVQSTKVQKFSVKTHVMSKSVSNEPVDIFSVTKPKKAKRKAKGESGDSMVFFEASAAKSMNPNLSLSRRRKSMREITKKAEQDLCNFPMTSSPSLPEISDIAESDRQATNSENFLDLISSNDKQETSPTIDKNEFFNEDGIFNNEDFSVYILPEKTNAEPSNSLKISRIKMIDRSIDIYNSIFRKLGLSRDQSVLKRSEDEKNRNIINQKLISTRRKGIEKSRPIAALHNIYYKKRQKIQEILKEMHCSKMARVAGFVEYLKKVKTENKEKVVPAVNEDLFNQSLSKMEQEPSKRIGKIKRKLKYIKQNLREIESTKPGTGDWYQNLIHPDTKTGQIIERFEGKVDELKYDDVYLIIQHIARKLDKSSKKKEKGNEFDPNEMFDVESTIDPNCSSSIDEIMLSENPTRKFLVIEQILFDLAWQKKKYPFGVDFKSSCYRNKPKLPVSADLFPAAIGNTLIPKEYAFTPFSALNGMNWPLKPAVDLIFNMFILTNPFEIARVFWNVIQETARCMQKIYFIEKGIPSEEVEIDFDSLFPVLMICVFTFGADEWLEIALYTISFNEQVPEDPQLQFAMTYLEGLVTHIMALDPKVLKKKASEMRNKWADEEHDPLGLK